MGTIATAASLRENDVDANSGGEVSLEARAWIPPAPMKTWTWPKSGPMRTNSFRGEVERFPADSRR